MERFGYGKAKVTCEEQHPGMTHEQYIQENELEEAHCTGGAGSRDEEPIEEGGEIKNPGKYKTGMEKGYDDDGDGVPDGADSHPKDGSKS